MNTIQTAKNLKGKYQWQLYTCDDRITFTEEEIQKFNDIEKINLSLEKTQDENKEELYDSIEINNIENKVKAKKSIRELGKEIQDLCNKSIEIQRIAELRFMSETFGDDVAAVSQDAIRVIDEMLVNFDYSNASMMLFSKTQKDAIAIFISEMLIFARIHLMYLAEKDRKEILEYIIYKVDSIITLPVEVKKELKIEELNKQIEKNPLFIKQGHPTNQLYMLNTKTSRNINRDELKDKATFKVGRLSVVVKNYITDKTYFDPNTAKLLEMLILVNGRTGCNSPKVVLSVEEYMTLRNIKGVEKARKRLDEQLRNLYEVSMRFEGFDNKYIRYSNLDIRILGDKGELTNGNIEVKFNDTFFQMIKEYSFMYYPQQLFALDERKNPNSYHLGKKITDHKRMNYKHKNADVVSVKTLLESCSGLADYKDISKSGQIRQRIIKPFERDMNALGSFIDWEYYSENGSLTTDERDNLDYTSFINLMVHITWHYYPESVKPSLAMI